MMKKFKATFMTLVCLLVVQFANAQTNSNVIDSFYESGKIKVVVASVLVLLFVLIFFLIRLERKVSKLEKEIKE